MKAWQRTIREQRAASDGDLLGRWWEGIDTDISRAEVRPISYKLAESVILEYEWLGCMPAVALHCYGIFFDGICGGAVVYGTEYGENLGVWDRYGYTGKLICLSRGASAHWTPPHTATKLIRGTFRLLPARYEVVTATVDERAGEIGTIYQACSFSFVGVMAESNAKQPRKVLLLSTGQEVSERQARQRFGSIKKACAVLPGASRLHIPYKGRYFAFRGSASTRRRHQRAIQHLIKPYPKRPSPEADAATNAEARFNPVGPLQVYAESA